MGVCYKFCSNGGDYDSNTRQTGTRLQNGRSDHGSVRPAWSPVGYGCAVEFVQGRALHLPRASRAMWVDLAHGSQHAPQRVARGRAHRNIGRRVSSPFNGNGIISAACSAWRMVEAVGQAAQITFSHCGADLSPALSHTLAVPFYERRARSCRIGKHAAWEGAAGSDGCFCLDCRQQRSLLLRRHPGLQGRCTAGPVPGENGRERFT